MPLLIIKGNPQRQLLEVCARYLPMAKGPNRSDCVFEDDPLVVSLALSFRLDAILASRLFFSTLDTSSSASYQQVNLGASTSSRIKYNKDILRQPVLVRFLGPRGGGTFLGAGSGAADGAGPATPLPDASGKESGEICPAGCSWLSCT
jgi:hypothetical protein